MEDFVVLFIQARSVRLCANTNLKLKGKSNGKIHIPVTIYIQGVSRLEDITAGGDFLGLCDQKSSHKHVSDFGRLRSYDRLKLRGEGNDY